MASLSLREAAEMAGVSKSSVFRAIKAGRISASRSDAGEFEIDVAELLRAYPPKRSGLDQLRQQMEQPEPPHHVERDGDLKARNAALEAEVKGLQALLAEVRAGRDTAQANLERLLVALPSPTERRRPWWPWRRAG